MARYTATKYNLMSAKLPEPLPDEIIKEEIRKYKEFGDNEALQKIVNHNLALVRSIVYNEIHYRFDEKEDLLGVGVLGLIKCLDTFDVNADNKFVTYATVAIKYAIYGFLKKERNYIREVETTLSYYYYNQKKDEETEENIEDDYIQRELIWTLREKIFSLPKRDRAIMILFYATFNETRFSITQIALLFGVSKQTISKIVRENTMLFLHNIGEDDVLKNANLPSIRSGLYKSVIDKYEKYYYSLDASMQDLLYEPEEMKLIKKENMINNCKYGKRNT